MRLLHTADWHVGKSLYGVDRLGECRDALAEIAAIARDESVDAVLVAGDLLDRRVVEPAALGVALEALTALARVAPVVAVPGNHDDPELWGHLAPLLAARDITVVPDVRPAERAVVDLDTGAGPLHVAALPWPEPARLGLPAGAERGTARSGYAQLVGDLVRAYAEELTARRARDRGPAVLMGHVMVDGSQAGAGERALTMALSYCLPTGSIPTGLDYIALGHVHRPQPLPGVAAPGRYCGSPLALDFSEDNHEKSVTVIDIGAPPREVPLVSGRPLVRIRGPLDRLEELARAHDGAWLRCEVELEEPVDDLVRTVRGMLPAALRVDPVVARQPASPDRRSAAAGRPAGDLAADYAEWCSAAGRKLAPRQAAAFAAAVEAARMEEQAT
jgi:DNA repair protein SbcD/Mre11